MIDDGGGDPLRGRSGGIGILFLFLLIQEQDAASEKADEAAGENGGDTYLVRTADGAELFRAYGGGGGGSSGWLSGQNGGSGGGSLQDTTSNGMIGGRGVAGQGHDGGCGGIRIASNSQMMPGGGGGAGEAGGDTDDASRTIGKGGDGLPCSITGDEIW